MLLQAHNGGVANRVLLSLCTCGPQVCRQPLVTFSLYSGDDAENCLTAPPQELMSILHS